MKTRTIGSQWNFTAETEEEKNSMMKVIEEKGFLWNHKVEGSSVAIFTRKAGLAYREEVEKLASKEEPIKAVKEATRRVMVTAGTYQVGDVAYNGVVTGLGKVFTTNEDTHSLNPGVSPDADYAQYVYIS